MKRDNTLFPENKIGDILWKMLLAGDDLTQVRELQFSVIFAKYDQALKFGNLLLENNQKLSLCTYQGDEQMPWEVTAYPEVVPNYVNIVGYKDLLTKNSEPFSGKYDGWFCLPK
ncbi:MAG: ribonuclease E inhibitor RraB [Colwellia sp.]|nr:ribonuclease E inhibitor RraB [Colwellia sp.]